VNRISSLRAVAAFGNKTAGRLLTPKKPQRRVWDRGLAMPEPAADAIVRNLIEALERLRGDLDRMELWAAALDGFQRPIPDYRPGDQHLLTSDPKRGQRSPA
jgi:hypothetical protein